ncbi:hypothetical protein EYF80_020496 [Liparis tanakae]|uniref:Uncharacterized protein n=1 Tax=Liparis tanakae TaxID=230148 RepID=A0A4Z2HVM6_9TELE|nr:hypothetical protein EYF80_020496 [Liparis tanakae]
MAVLHFSVERRYRTVCVRACVRTCPHRVAREPSMIIPSGDSCQPTGVPQVLHRPPILVAGIN